MLREIDNFYLQLQEPQKSCLMAMRHFILHNNENITETWKYKMPVFCYNGKMFCYLWIEKHNSVPYLGIVEGNYVDHALLVKGERSRMKILYLDPSKDLPFKIISQIFAQAKLRYH